MSIRNIFQWKNPPKGKKWGEKKQFCDKIKEIQDYLMTKQKITQMITCKDCLICHEKCISKHKFSLYNFVWDDGMCHYIMKHDLKPPQDFIDKVYNYVIKEEILPYRLKGKYMKSYVQLHRNQIMILDALMKHGGYTKKYIDTKNKKERKFHYSEHSGMLDFGVQGLNRIIVSGNITRIDRGDEEIFLPVDLPDIYNFEYIFHTHPPTPKPGGRSVEGIIYEFPSIGDIFHFINHFNEGKIIGSLVMTSEGLYNIRKLIFDKKKIKIDEDLFFKEIKKLCYDLHNDSIKKYGIKFSTYIFYSKIAQDTSFIDKFNELLNKYQLIIDYYPRTYDGKTWFVDSIHLLI